MTNYFVLLFSFWLSANSHATNVVDLQTLRLQSLLRPFEGVFIGQSDITEELLGSEPNPNGLSLYRLVIIQDEIHGPRLVFDSWNFGKVDRRFSAPLKDLPKIDRTNLDGVSSDVSATGLSMMVNKRREKYGKSLTGKTETTIDLGDINGKGISVHFLKRGIAVRDPMLGSLRRIGGGQAGYDILTQPVILNLHYAFMKSQKENQVVTPFSFAEGKYSDKDVECSYQLTSPDSKTVTP